MSNLLALQLLQSFSAFTVFLAIGAVGFLFLLISLLVGELFDHGVEMAGDLDHGGPGFFSPRILGVFITAFGGTGAVASNMGLGVLPSSVLAGFSGVVFSSLIFMFARFLYSQQASSDVKREDLIGRLAEVTVTIPGGGIGQVRCLVGETFVDRIARGAGAETIAVNTVVTIEASVGETVVVRPKGA